MLATAKRSRVSICVTKIGLGWESGRASGSLSVFLFDHCEKFGWYVENCGQRL